MLHSIENVDLENARSVGSEQEDRSQSVFSRHWRRLIIRSWPKREFTRGNWLSPIPATRASGPRFPYKQGCVFRVEQRLIVPSEATGHWKPFIQAELTVLFTLLESKLPGFAVRRIGRWPGNNPVLISNLAVIAVSGSVSTDLVRNIIFNELLRVDWLAPISVNQVHGHPVVNLIVQQVIAPAINYRRRVTEVDQVEQENSGPIESLSATVGYQWVRSELILMSLEFFVDPCARFRVRRVGR
jgi:hypothetical protein